MTPTHRLKPFEVEARQFVGNNGGELVEWIDSVQHKEASVYDRFSGGVFSTLVLALDKACEQEATPTDWIVLVPEEWSTAYEQTAFLVYSDEDFADAFAPLSRVDG